MKRTQTETNQDDIEAIMNDAHDGTQRLTAEELLWVRLAIKKEAQAILFRQAVIEKTTSALVWSIIVGLGYLILELLTSYIIAHGWRK